MALRVVFMGTPDFAVPTLSEIVGQGHEVVAVYTRAPRRRPAAAWREQPSPVHETARELRHPGRHAEDAAQRRRRRLFRRHEADVAVVVAYGLILPKADPRGAARSAASTCTPRCCRAGAARRRSSAPSWPATARPASMVMRMEEGLDTGPVCLAERVAIGADETAGELHDRLAMLGADLMVRALAAL